MEKTPEEHSPSEALTKEEAQVLQAINDTPVDFETLSNLTGFDSSILSCALMMLEIVGRIKQIHGNQYVRAFRVKTLGRTSKADSILTDKAKRKVVQFIDFVQRCLHGISRKYLQLHLARFGFFINRMDWSSSKLFAACIIHGKITELEISKYKSPLIVQLPDDSSQALPALTD